MTSVDMTEKAAVQDRIRRRREVLARVGIGQSTMYDWMARGGFPRPLAPGAKMVGWPESAITAWIEARRTRDGKTPAELRAEAEGQIPWRPRATPTAQHRARTASRLSCRYPGRPSRAPKPGGGFDPICAPPPQSRCALPCIDEDSGRSGPAPGPGLHGPAARLTLLEPDIVEAILDGRQGPDVTLTRLLEPLPSDWRSQRCSGDGVGSGPDLT